MDDVVVRVEGMERPECNGMYAVAGQRNGRHAFNKRDGSEGALYYDGSHWKCCQSGRGTSKLTRRCMMACRLRDDTS